MAKARGFGRKSTTEVDPAPTPAAAANQKARRTPRSRPASRPEGAATEKAARPTPASKRRSRVRAASPMRCTVSIRNPAMHMFVLSAVGTISALAASRPWRAGVRFAADSALEGTGFELLVRGRVKLVVGRRRQRNRTARRSRCRCTSWPSISSYPAPGQEGKDIVVLDRWAEDRTEGAVSSLARSRPVSVL